MVLDTHALIWWVSNPAKLSARARRAIGGALRAGPVIASAISIFEIATALRRGRLVLQGSAEQWLADLRSLPELRIEPLTADIAQMAGSFEDAMSGDPADRMIAATAIAFGQKLVTADKRLHNLARPEALW